MGGTPGNCHNPKGTPATLVASHPGNTNTVTHGAYSTRLQEPRAREIAAEVLKAPWACDLDELGAIEVGRLEAFIERLDAAIDSTKGKPQRELMMIRLRASGHLRDWLTAHGMNPHARAHWAKQLATGGIVGEIQRRREQLDREHEERSNGLPT